jgi:hypothetical protein
MAEQLELFDFVEGDPPARVWESVGDTTREEVVVRLASLLLTACGLKERKESSDECLG